jgi:hypothetical protein
VGEVSELQITSLELNGLGRYFTLTPHHRLMPGKHTLLPRIAQTREQLADWGNLGAEFEVGTANSEAPLPPPTARVVRWDNQDRGMCGAAVGAKLQVSPTHWLLAYRAIDPAKPNDPNRTEDGYELAANGSLWIGHGPCTWSWDFSRGAARVRFGSVDYAGRFSGYGPPVELVAPWSPAELHADFVAKIRPRAASCACRFERQSRAVFGSGGWLLLLMGVVLRRATKARSAAAGRRFGVRPKAARSRW